MWKSLMAPSRLPARLWQEYAWRRSIPATVLVRNASSSWLLEARNPSYGVRLLSDAWERSEGRGDGCPSMRWRIDAVLGRRGGARAVIAEEEEGVGGAGFHRHAVAEATGDGEGRSWRSAVDDQRSRASLVNMEDSVPPSQVRVTMQGAKMGIDGAASEASGRRESTVVDVSTLAVDADSEAQNGVNERNASRFHSEGVGPRLMSQWVRGPAQLCFISIALC
jgi:hypothetical protein